MEKVVQKHRDWNKIRVAVFDFDGTISTLRSGWESVMEKHAFSILRILAAIRLN